MNSPLQDTFQLNQSNLQDFLDCPRRFELKVMQETNWPAPLTEPPSRFEELTEVGDKFHKICNQFFLGIDSSVIESSIQDAVLDDLWSNFLPYGESLAGNNHFTEQILRTSLNNYLLVAKYDFIAQLPDTSFLIVDWKTSLKKPDRSVLANRVQTYLYPYIFYESFQDLYQVSQPHPDSLVFRYYYPAASDPEETFPYSDTNHLEVKDRLSSIISRIDHFRKTGSDFPLTEDLNLCQFCNFKSYCERGNSAQSITPSVDFETEDLSNSHFDLDLIEEIEF